MPVLPPTAVVFQRVESRYPGLTNAFLRRVHQTGALAATSWWRSVAHNREVKGAPDSQHLLGLAVDLIPRPNSSTYALAERARRLGLVAVPYTGHVHVQAFPKGRARELGLLPL